MKTSEKKGHTAKANYIQISPTKARRVADQVRGLPYVEAMSLLEHMPQRGAKFIRKAIHSAASNAMYQNDDLDEDMLYVKSLLVDEGPRMKRLWYRARGRADIIHKRLSHITVVVDEIANTGE